MKTHSPSSFAAGSSTGIFTITPSNIGAAPTSGTITLSDTLPAGLTLASVPNGTGWTCSGTVGGSSFTCTTTSVIAAASNGNAVSFRAQVASGASGQLLTNQAVISGGGEPAGFNGNNTATDTVGIASAATVSGTVWRDDDHDRQIDGGEDLIDDSLRQLETEFGNRVIRVHRSALVNRDYIEAIERNAEGQLQIRLRGREERMPVSRRLASELKAHFQIPG